MHTYIQCQNQQVNRRHIKITYLLTAQEPARGLFFQDNLGKPVLERLNQSGF